ncbi:NAD(P)/FAD-dependent oxidoreductase [Kineosporia succinea]|uniref:Geranylgeranyl reductase family protein n=1 Tax=Kineosporia succinea TaxID=84632 RepID=A0ABT9NXH3_9ACTN|nr:geranylgeranyl reductase family protein [Kineosporia succinea]MDP9825124.1 geranylgeranyl reductase family protein [Kineosporia succinea]
MSEIADVLVVGAGPAGASAALAALRQNPEADVRLLDLADFPRDKACGDGIAPHALTELERLGVPRAEITRGHGPIRTLDLRSPAGVRLEAHPHDAMHVIPRTVFDARLVQAARAKGATLVKHRARHLKTHDGYVSVDGEHAGRTLIVADGANSTLRRALDIPRNGDQHLAVAIRGYAPERPTDHVEPTQLITMQDSWPAYAWSFPLADGSGTANIGYGRLRSQLRTRHDATHPGPEAAGRQDLEDELERLLPGQPAEGLRAHHLPLSTWRPHQPDGRVLLVGDAASLVNPLTGEGIFYAVRSGRLAGEAAVSSDDPGRTYREALHAALGRHLRQTTWLANLSRRHHTMDAAMDAARARPETMHRLIDLGLGDGLIPKRMVPRVLAHYARRRLVSRPSSTDPAR